MLCQIHVTELNTTALCVVQSFFNLTQYNLTQHFVQPDTAATLCAICSFRALTSPALPKIGCQWKAEYIDNSCHFLCSESWKITYWFSLLMSALENALLEVKIFKTQLQNTFCCCSSIIDDNKFWASLSVCVLLVVTSQSNMFTLKAMSEESAADWKWWFNDAAFIVTSRNLNNSEYNSSAFF